MRVINSVFSLFSYQNIFFLSIEVQKNWCNSQRDKVSSGWLWRWKKQLCQRAKKVVSNSPGLVDFAIGLVNSVRKSSFLRNSKYSKVCEIKSAHKKVSGLVEITFGPVKAIFSWSEWQAVKMTFYAPCIVLFIYSGKLQVPKDCRYKDSSVLRA